MQCRSLDDKMMAILVCVSDRSMELSDRGSARDAAGIPGDHPAAGRAGGCARALDD